MKKYNCPKCDKPHNDWDLIYIVNGGKNKNYDASYIATMQSTLF